MRFAFVLSLALMIPFSGARAGEWELLRAGNLRFNCVAVADKGGSLLGGTQEGEVAVSVDGGKSWRQARCGKGDPGAVNDLWFDPGLNRLLAAADRGIFVSLDKGRNWKQLYKPSPGVRCLAVLSNAGKIYAGTEDGLLVTTDGRLWSRQDIGPGAGSITLTTKGVICVTGSGMYRERGRIWDNIGRGFRWQNGDEEETGTDVTEEPASKCLLRANGERVIFAEAQGIYESADGGDSWEYLPLSPRGVSAACLTRDGVAAAAGRGVYFRDGERWEERTAGLGAAPVNGLACSGVTVFAATADGMFKAAVPASQTGLEEPGVGKYLENEPGIALVMEKAVEYADAGRERMADWRKRAARKAWMPEVSVGFDRDIGDLWHWESGSTTKEGDDCLRRGRDSIDWNVSFKWDLGELVWNPDQTSIDARARLASERREEVIDEVVKLYYERVRLKMEIAGLPLEDRKKRFEKTVRLAEMTARLDGLTDGMFTAVIAGNGAKKSCQR